MSLKKLGILTAVLILLGAYFYFYEIRVEREKKEAEEKAKKVIIFKPEEIEELKLKINGKILLFSKKGEQWAIKEPVVAKADNASIEKALAVIKKAEIERTINEKPDNLKDYGLEKPSMEITIKEKDKSPLETILIGNRNPTDYYVYFKKESSLPVKLTYSGLKNHLSKGVYYYRDKTVLNLKVEDIKGLYVRYKDKKADLKLDDKGDWQIISPIRTKADGGRFRRLLYGLSNSRIGAFVEEDPKDLKKYGLDSSDKEITFFTDKKHPVKSLLIGNRARDGFYTKWRDEKNVFFISKNSLRDYPKTEFDLRDKTIMDFNKEKIVKVELKYPHDRIMVVSDKKNVWNIIKPKEVSADEFEISDLLWAILDMEAKKFISEVSTDSKTYNLDKPLVEINLWEKGKKKPLRLVISKRGNGKKELFAKTSARETIYQVSPDILKDIIKTTFNLRDKTILTFKNEEVGKLQLKYSDKTLVLKLVKGEWKTMKPEETKLNKAEVISFLWDIKLLKFKEILSDGLKEDLSMYGFDKPEANIALWGNKEDKIGTIIIGKKATDKDILYAKVDSSPTIYGIDPKFLEKLPYSINDFK